MQKFKPPWRKVVFVAGALVGLVACDTSTRDRRPTKSSNGNAYSYFNPGTSGFGTSPGSTSGTGTTSGTTTGTATPTATTVPDEIKHCSWSFDGQTGYEKTHQHIGSYTLCKSSVNSMDVFIQVKTPITDAMLCLIPTAHSGSSSTYIGEPRCLNVDTNAKVYKVSMVKNRTGFTNYTMTGIMLMKDKQFYYGAPFYSFMLSPDAYLFCNNWLAQTGDPSYCYAFNQVGQYVYHQF